MNIYWIFQAQGYKKNKIIKMNTYNVYYEVIQDSIKHKSEFAEWSRKQNPDMLNLQKRKRLISGIYEFTPDGANFKNFKKLIENYEYSFYSNVGISSHSSATFPIIVISKYPTVIPHRVLENIYESIEEEIEDLHLIITHFHSFSFQKKEYEKNENLTNIKSNLSNYKQLFMEDLNSIYPLEKQYT
jgi:exodeoxyribonuclease III